MASDDLPFDPDPRPPGAPAEALPATPSLRTTALAELNRVDAGIAALRTAYGGKTFEVEKPAGLEAAKSARLAVRNVRYQVPHIVKARKADLKLIAAEIDSEGTRITNALLEIENPIHQQITDEETRREQEKARKAAEEAARVQRHQQAIADIRDSLVKCAGRDAATLGTVIEELRGLVVNAETFEEFEPVALRAKTETLEKLEAMLATQRSLEERERVMEAERVERERVQAIRIKIDAIRELRFNLGMCRTAARVQQVIDRLPALAPDESFAEFRDEAQELFDQTSANAQEFLTVKQEAEAQAAAIAAAAAPAPAPAPVSMPPLPSIDASALPPAPNSQPEVAQIPAAPAPVRAPVSYAPPPAVAPRVSAPAPAPAIAPMRQTEQHGRPTDDQIINALATFFRVHESTVLAWLQDMDLEEANQRLAGAF